MARPPKPERKIELLDQIVEYLLDKTFASLSFRTLADGLGISSYVLVYHFGNREELINEIVRHIEARHDAMKPENPEDLTPEGFREWLREGWDWLLIDRNRNLQRLEFEAAVQDPVSPAPRGSATRKFAFWHAFITDWLVAQGVPRERADPAARVFTSSLYGLQYDYVLNNDRAAVEQAVDLSLDLFLQSLETSLQRGR
ncbi:DNA-binding transcriptional regulator, AcrR family [Arthrobacter subterraneus]|uniref:DNA-binding transcriptional regulator, AcrR family n=1 Tax=Arthrobacter subterraneus TaxID=335973 RepID=A0A1G8CVI7_9MICC|nr:TetR/AcrR family transcriptional regulator [Arthrobacter subterraneus]SDH48970.1 DNA-binding transcriptional regulator, AcrR family [Arthrobacter subterraneus]